MPKRTDDLHSWQQERLGFCGLKQGLLKQEGLSGMGLSLSELRKCYLLMVGLQY